jgi:acetyl-CoA C-acetyltransferase
VPVPLPDGAGVVEHDEHPRAILKLNDLAKLRPIRSHLDSEATVTAGNASGQNDGAAACVVTSRRVADAHGLRPLLAIKATAVTGVAPEAMGIGPVAATAAALRRAGLTMDDLGLIELNEAFAAQVLACLAEWEIEANDQRLNPNGSGISLGHPVGATGARILATLAHEIHRTGDRYALETLCIGGGQGIAAIFERVDS